MRLEYLFPLIGYLLGSIPFGYIFVRLTFGGDIRKSGSGNIGATNVFRQNRSIGILTLLADGGKGYLAVMAAAWMGGSPGWQGAAAVAAIVGHMFTIWLGFKGGKGVATGCGAYLALAPTAVGTTLIVFMVTAALTRYVALASILAAAAFPLWVYLFGKPHSLLIGALIGSALIVVRHHENIRRLLAGTENRFALGSRPR